MDPWKTAQTLRQTLANRGILLDRLFSSSSVLLNPLFKFKMHLRVLDGYKEGTEGYFFLFWQKQSIYSRWYVLGFPTGRESAIFWDKGIEVPSLSRDKGTMGQAQNLSEERVGPGF